jgi:Fungal specific transcription factor domain
MPGLRDMVTVFTVPSHSMLHRLLSHFTEFGPTWLSIGPGRRRTAFLTHVIPMALESFVVMNCIFAISAADLTKYHTGEHGLEMVALEMHSKALTELNTAINQEIMRDSPISADTSDSGKYTSYIQIGVRISRPTFGADAVLLAVLLQCLHEAHNFSESSRLLPHLNAAATLSWRRLQQLLVNTELREFLLTLFCYFFALATVSHGLSMANGHASQVFASILARYQQTETETETEKRPLLGQLEHLLWTIFRVSTLAMQTSADSFEDAIRRSELMGLESQLHDWKVTDLNTEAQFTREVEKD